MKQRNTYKRKNSHCKSCSSLIERRKGGGIKYCRDCSILVSVCKVCNLGFLISRRTFAARGAVTCSMSCYGVWRSKIYVKEKSPTWKGGLNNVIAYRARKAGSEGTHTSTEWENLKRQFSYTCLCCKRPEPEIKLEADHIKPLSKGGSNDIGNIQPLCRSCNARKHDKNVDFRLTSSKKILC